MNALNGLDGKSVLIGGALALGGLAAAAGGLLPLLLVGGLVYLVGAKQGWWGRGPHPERSDPTSHRPPGVPPFFAEWHRQAHAADAWSQAAAGSQSVAPAPTPPPHADAPVSVAHAPTAPPAPATVPEPATTVADDRRTAGEVGAPPP